MLHVPIPCYFYCRVYRAQLNRVYSNEVNNRESFALANQVDILHRRSWSHYIVPHHTCDSSYEK